jgi:rubrerythrin
LPAPSSSASSSFSSSSSSSSASSSSNTSSTDRATHRQTDRTQLKQRTVPANKHASAHCHGCGYMFRSPAEEYCPICAHWRR